MAKIFNEWKQTEALIEDLQASHVPIKIRAKRFSSIRQAPFKALKQAVYTTVIS